MVQSQANQSPNSEFPVKQGKNREFRGFGTSAAQPWVRKGRDYGSFESKFPRKLNREFFRPNRGFRRRIREIISAIRQSRRSVLIQSTRALSDAERSLLRVPV